jgi:hypothetical protein
MPPLGSLELYAWSCYLLPVVEFLPDVAVFAVVCDMTGRWSVLAPVNHHPGFKIVKMLAGSELFAILLLCYFIIRSLRVDARRAFLQTAIYARRIGALVRG